MSFIAQLNPFSVPGYLFWRASGRRTNLNLRLNTGSRIRFRPRTPLDNDYGTAYEVFVLRYYDVPSSIVRDRVKLIVDLGANVGFTCVHWLKEFPHARVIALEPHPRHAELCRINLALNDGAGRVVLHEVAAGVGAGTAQMLDAGTSSQLMEGPDAGIEVKVVDTLSLLAPLEIDLLKIDIEGSEYSILSDVRFDALNIHAIVMEWHRGEGPEKDGAWCRRRLEGLGYSVSSIFEEATHGMIWAVR